jgi:two-component system sensor histidine kinase VanS
MTYLRGIVILAACAVIYMIAETYLSRNIDALYRQSGSSLWYSLFYFLGRNRLAIALLGTAAIALIASKWIFRPYLAECTMMYTRFIRENLHFNNDAIASQGDIPKHMKPLEEVLNNVNTEVKLSKYAAKEAEQRKDDLVVYLAHDIRTPLTSVLGYLELITENRDLPEAYRDKYTDTALRKAKRMQSLVEELFEITRYSITQIELEKTEVNLSMMLTQLVEEVRPVFEQRGIEAEVSLEEVPLSFIDPEKVARSLENVLHNAAFYTPQGGKITVTLDSADTMARIRISNTGSEIPPEKLARFFEKFYRGEESRQSETGGSGLGLAIAKNIIEAHGGSIIADNKEKVTTFTITI